MIFQFTTSQGGRQLLGRHLGMWNDLSIHDLSRRSTRGIKMADIEKILSIHDLSRRSTRLPACTCLTAGSFNSRPLKEVDISPHYNQPAAFVFQFTTSQGGRLYCAPNLLHSRYFQFTTSQGGRRWSINATLSFRSFNSRPLKEVDTMFDHWSEGDRSFNSRPLKEVDIKRQ